MVKEAENWGTMEDAFNSISKHASVADRTKAYHKPRYEDSISINEIHNQQRVRNEYSKCIFRENNQPNNVKQIANKTNQTLECYYCNEPYYITNCMKFKTNKDKYKLTAQQVKSKYLEKIRQGAQKKNISISEVALENDHAIEQGYTEEEAEQLCNIFVNMYSD